MQFDNQLQLAVFFYGMIQNRYAATEEIISPKEAYQEIRKGNFEQFAPFQPDDVLHVESYEITYTYDTKGYYQPVYQFNGYINEKDNSWTCQIPALQ